MVVRIIVGRENGRRWEGTSVSPNGLGNSLPSSAWLRGWLSPSGKAATLASLMTSQEEPTPRQSDLLREAGDFYLDDLNPKTPLPPIFVRKKNTMVLKQITSEP